MKARFTPNYSKIIQAIAWIATKKPNIDIYHINKILFYADKYHLQNYGRPVTGDVYMKANYGPVPSLAYDILKQEKHLPAEILKNASANIKVTYKHDVPMVTAKKTIQEQEFSGTDFECLEKAFAECSDKNFEQLVCMTHDEKAWVEASLNNEMDTLLMIDANVPNQAELIEYIKETAPCMTI